MVDHSETDRAEPGRAPQAPAASRALVAVAASGPGPRIRGGRPMSGFLTQLIVSADPALRPARAERTKAAVALYAQAAAFGKRA